MIASNPAIAKFTSPSERSCINNKSQLTSRELALVLFTTTVSD